MKKRCLQDSIDEKETKHSIELWSLRFYCIELKQTPTTLQQQERNQMITVMQIQIDKEDWLTKEPNRGRIKGVLNNSVHPEVHLPTWRAITPVANWVIGWAVTGRASMALYTKSATRNDKPKRLS